MDTATNEIKVGDLVCIRRDAELSVWAANQRRWRDGRYIGVIKSIGMDIDRLKVGFHDDGMEYSYFFDREELELADIDALDTTSPYAPFVPEVESLKRAHVALLTISSYSDDPMTWEEIVTGLENEANRLQALHLLTADALKAGGKP